MVVGRTAQVERSGSAASEALSEVSDELSEEEEMPDLVSLSEDDAVIGTTDVRFICRC